MKTRFHWYTACAFAAVSGPALAAEPIDRKPLMWHLDAGYVMTDDDTSDFLDDGWMLEAASLGSSRAGYEPSEP
jgi:hypothetical protein